MAKVGKQLRNFRQIRLVFLVAGVAAVLAGSVLLARAIVFVQRAVPGEGRVTHVERSHSSSTGRTGSETTYLPTFEFTDEQGIPHSVSTNHSSSSYDYRVGQVVPIRYNPNNPQNVRVDTFMGIWGAASIVLPMGLASIGASLVVGTQVKRLQARADVVASTK